MVKAKKDPLEQKRVVFEVENDFSGAKKGSLEAKKALS